MTDTVTIPADEYAALKRDAERVEFLFGTLYCADFAYPSQERDGETISALVFAWPWRVSPNMRASIDNAMKESNP